MKIDPPHQWWLDPEILTQRARLFLGQGDEAEPGVVDEALRRAFRRVAAELETIERQQAQHQQPDIAELFASQRDEKLASLLLLAKYILLDLAHFPREVLDITLAHRDLALISEILFRAHAAAGLMALYDFAHARMRQGNAKIWQNVCGHCLMLLALMETERAQVVALLARRPAARKQLRDLVSFTRPQVIDVLQREIAAADPAAADPEAPSYLRLFERLDPDLPLEEVYGLASLLLAEHRIAQALQAEDLGAAVRWFREGSRSAARETLRRARERLPRRAYRFFLETILAGPPAHPVRVSAVVLELGSLDRGEKPTGGVGDINRLLFEVAMTPNKELQGVARVAVHQLRDVHNLDALLVIIEQAPQQRVAEEAILAMQTLRRLLMVEPLMKRRPRLAPAYQAARDELLEIQKIMEQVWNTDTEAEVRQYVQRLKELHATPELDTIAELAERKGDRYRLQLSAMR